VKENQNIPKRIISLCPSITQTINDLGKGNLLCGVTDYCPVPEELKDKITRIGGPKNVNIEKTRKLQPDLIIFVEEENSLKDYNALSDKYNCKAYRISNFADSISMLKEIGNLLDSETESEKIIEEINFEYPSLCNENMTYYYFVWKEPLICAGANTYINSFLKLFGLKNLSSNSGYPKLSKPLLDQNADIIFLPDEPYQFNPANTRSFQSDFPYSRLVFLDGKTCSWFGSYSLKGIREFNKLLRSFR
jgi:ABC-type Fe3+-hydroxamate transport system substrate-binding protein